jgi:hypothetical protein
MKKIGQIVESFLRKEKIGSFADNSRTENDGLLEKWAQIVGNKIASKTQPHRIERNNLFIYVDNSVIMNEMTYLKSGIKKSVNDYLKEKKIKDIIFRIRQ